jgi:hypothetical protein
VERQDARFRPVQQEPSAPQVRGRRDGCRIRATY